MATDISLGVPTDEEEEEESEWEYEYHETDTEDFYITLDLSSHSRQFAHGIKNSSTNSASQDSKTPAPTFDTPNFSQEGNNATTDGTLPNEHHNPPISALDPALTTSSEKRKRIQIADLHTRNPLISYNSQLYSCDWTTTLGTEMFFAATPVATTEPNPDPDPESSSQPHPPPKPPPPHASLLATTRIKLSAHPVQVTPRPTPSASVLPATATSPPHPPPPTSTSEVQEEEEEEEQPLSIPLPPNAKPLRQNQAAFLTRLINIKRARGETDEVNVYAGSRDGLQRGGGGAAGGGGEEGGDGGEEDNDGESVYMPEGSTAGGMRGASRARSRGTMTGRGSARGRRAGKLDYGPSKGRGGMAPAEKTPERWHDLGRFGDDYARRMVDEGEEEDWDVQEGDGEGTMDWMQ